MTQSRQLYFNADVYTADGNNPAAEAVAVEGGIIREVGSREDCQASLGSDFEEIDLEGAALLPGFIDTHTHPPMMLLYEIYADTTGLKSYDELCDMLKGLAADKPETEWIMGLQFEEQNFDKPRTLDRHDLDAACPNHPTIVVKRDGHSLIANTRAIETVGIDGSTPDPEGGKIDRELDGYPSGVFRELAVKIFMNALPFPSMDTIMAAADSTFERITGQGITSISVILQTDEEGVLGEQGVFDIPLMELIVDRIPISLYGMIAAKNVEAAAPAFQSKLHRKTVGEDHRVGAIKLWADGSFSSCTALMNEPFTDQPDTSGFLVHTEEEIYRRFVDIHTSGLQIAVHSIGDRSTEILLELFERLLGEHPRDDHRHRIEHASQLSTEIISRMARLGLVISTQPLFIHSERNWLHRRLGRERTRWTYPFRSILDAGIRMSGSSDAPIESMDVLHAIQCCVTREGFQTQECITADEAIRMYTLDAAYAQFEETVKGSLSVGKRADMVVLSASPVKVSPEKIREIKVLQTIVNGKTVFGDS